jgi:hypothetical protein
MLKRISIYCLSNFLFFNVLADDGPRILVDKVCASVDGKPILRSDIIRTKTNDPLQTLLEESALWVYAKQKLMFNVPGIQRSAEQHALDVMNKNNLTRSSFERILNQEPYNTTYARFIETTAFELLREKIKASIASTIQISDEETERAMAKGNASFEDFDVVFLSVLPKPGLSKKASLSYQFNKANEIKKQIVKMRKLDVIKGYYEKDVGVRLIGPMKYEPGSLLARYDQELKKNPRARVTEPFEDDEAVSMIIKIEASKSDKTVLENVRNRLYNEAVQRELHAIAQDTLANTPVVINCEREAFASKD